VATVDELAVESSYHCTIGRKQGCIRSQAEAFKKGQRVGHAAASGDGDGNAGLLRHSERLAVTPAHGLLVVRKQGAREQGSVHVDGYQANGRVHISSVAGEFWQGSIR
jgi:hypothetical protein